jgi:hypothetical protein
MNTDVTPCFVVSSFAQLRKMRNAPVFLFADVVSAHRLDNVDAERVRNGFLRRKTASLNDAPEISGIECSIPSVADAVQEFFIKAASP